MAAGYTQIKLKVGLSLTDDVRRMGIARSVAGDGMAIATDANQRWDVGAAIEWVRALEPFAPAGSRSRPAPTTSSATGRSDAPARCRWPPASTCRTA